MLRYVEGKHFDDSLLQEIESRIVRLVRQAGEMALDKFRSPLHVEYKQENRVDPVTEADRGIEAFLRSAILREFPEHAILGEEGTEVEVAEREFVWVLDPVDGTSNFVNGLPLFACSAALLRGGEPMVGAIFLPVTPLPAREVATPGAEGATSRQLRSGVIHARLRGGAFLENEFVRASEASVPEASSLAGLPGHHARQFQRRGHLRLNPGEPRCLGSVCFETAMVASGVYRYAVFRKPRLWDVAAGTLIVREAGGQSLGWLEGRWEPLTRFEPMANPKKPEERGYRFWTAPVLVGGSRVARFVADRLFPRPTPRRTEKGLPAG